MFADTEHTGLEKKRVLKKIRTGFVAKRPEHEEDILLPVPNPLNPYKAYMINGAWGIVEQDRKIYVGIKYLNSCLHVTNAKIEDYRNSKQVVLRPQLANQACLLPWEYSVKRLESYGDLELATIAHQIREFNGKYNHLIGQYRRTIGSQNKELEVARQNARDLRNKIESTYPYQVMTFIYDNNGANLHSMTFTESILKEIGHNVEGFARWAEINGIPLLFSHAAKLPVAVAKHWLTMTFSPAPTIHDLPEIEAMLRDKNGEERRVVTQAIGICEPTEHGFVYSGYTIIKSSEICGRVGDIEEKIKDEWDEPGMKRMKHETDEV